MIEKAKILFNKYKELIMYLFFGGLTTLINIVTFMILDKLGMDVYLNNTIAWIVAVVFAYVTNKLFVFESKSTKKEVLLKEATEFFLARVFSYFVDMGVIFVLIKKMGVNKLISKIVSNVIVIIINYILSKFIIFKKKK